MTQFITYDPATRRPGKRPRKSKENTAPPNNPAKRARVSLSSDTMNTPLAARELVDIRARLDPSARMGLALKVLDVGNISITRLLMYRLESAETCHFKNAFFSEGGGLETFLKELVEQYPAAEDCISRAVGYNLTLKKVSAEMDLVKSHTLLSSTETTPHLMRDWTIGIPEHLAPCLSSILRASAVSDRAVKENKTKKDTFTVSLTITCI